MLMPLFLKHTVAFRRIYRKPLVDREFNLISIKSLTTRWKTIKIFIPGIRTVKSFCVGSGLQPKRIDSNSFVWRFNINTSALDSI